MHVSLDSALGRQRRLNSVGESVLQIAPSAAAAYSLRSLTGGDPKVVRVRRASDNHEQDFTASGVSSGALTSFVNAQVVAPLDIQALSATGRDGDFLIAKAAYSLRSLGTRQATLAATGDTVARANGKFVAQVRRSSDDALKSFTADEVTDGTLLSFVGTSGSDNGFVKTWYDQSVTNQAGDTATGNHAVQATAASQPKIVNAGSLIVDGQSKASIKFTASDTTSLVADNVAATQAYSTIFKANADKTGASQQIIDGDTSTTSFIQIGNDGVIDINNGSSVATSADLDSLPSDFILTAIINGSSSNALFNGSNVAENQNVGSNNLVGLTIGKHRSSSANYYDNQLSELIVFDSDQTDNRTAIEANIGEAYSIDLPSGVDPGFDQVDGFVETWYDQSGNSNDAVQATASLQPKIVNAGSLIAKGLDFDGTDDFLQLESVLEATSGQSLFVVVELDALDSSTGMILDNRDGNGDGSAYFVGANKFKYLFDSNASVAELSASTNQSLVSAFKTSSDVAIGINGETLDTASNTDTISVTTVPRIGARSFSSASAFLGGEIAELIIYNADESSNRTALETNINSHYSIF